MALPRPALIALVGVFLALAAFVAARGATGDGGGETVVSPSEPAVTPDRDAPARAGRRDGGTDSRSGARRRGDEAAEAPARVRRVESTSGLPLGVASAIRRDEVIVLFFSQSRGADDAATRDSVRELGPKRGKLAVFSDKVANVSAYRRLIDSVGVTQSPSIVIVNRDLKAQLFEGYVDAGSLRQHVADALK